MSSKRQSVLLVFLLVSVVLAPAAMQLGTPSPQHKATSPAPQASPSVISNSETAAVSSAVSYYSAGSVTNSGTAYVSISIDSNSSASSYSFSNTAALTVNSADTYASATYTLSGAPQYVYAGSTDTFTITFSSLALYLGQNEAVSGNPTSVTQSINTIWANISIDGNGNSWSYSFSNFDSSSATGNYAIISPSWSIDLIPGDQVLSNFQTATLTIAEQAASGFPWNYAAPHGPYTTTTDQGQNVIDSSSTPSTSAVNVITGYHYAYSTLLSNAISSTISLPSSETAFNIVWASGAKSTPSISSYITYESSDYTGTSGTITGNAAHGAGETLAFAANGDPSAGQYNGLTETFSYYLASQQQASAAKVTDTSSPGYSLNNTATTLNEFTGSFAWSFSTPSGDIFADFGGTLTTVFTTTVNVSNPYSADPYNLLSWTASSGTDSASSSQGVASPSFTNTLSLTTSGTDSATISMTLLANTYPTFSTSPSTTFVSGSEVKVTFSTAEFFTNLENVTVVWGDGTNSVLSDHAAGSYTFYHNYTGTYSGSFSQTFTITTTVSNVPTPSSVPAETSSGGALSYTLAATDALSPAPGSALKSGSSISLTISGLTDLSSPVVTATINGAAATVTSSGLSFSVSSSLFGTDGVNVVWTVKYALTDTVSASYSQELVPQLNSSYCTARFSNTLLNGLADATVNNTGYQHFRSWQPTADNISAAQYTYVIPDQFNMSYLTVILNASWVFDYASYSVYATASSPYNSVTFKNISGIGEVSFTVTEPLSVGQPLGTVSLGVSPSVALGGYAFFELPAGYLHWTANGIPVNPAGFPAVIGRPVNVLGLDTAGTIVANTTIVPSAAQQFIQLYVNVSEFKLMNENMNETVQVEITSGGITQNITDVLPFETATVYIPSGTYTFHFVYLNYTTGQTLQDLTQVYTVNGLAWWIFKGLLLNQIEDSITFTRSNISNEINTEQITLLLQDSNITNLTLRVGINLSATNTSIHNVMSQILLNETFLNDTIGNVNINLQNKILLVQDAIGVLNASSADYFQIERSIILNGNLNSTERYTLENQSGVFAYKLVPEGTVVQPYGVETSLYLQTASGSIIDNSTLVGMVAKNLTMKIISTASQDVSSFRVLGHNSQSIQVAIYLTAQQIQTVLQNGSAALQMYSPFKYGALSNFAAGSINPSTRSVQTYGIWGTLGLPPPPPSVNFGSIQGILNTLAYIGQSPIGRSIYLIAILLAIVFYALNINQIQRRQHTRYRNLRTAN